MFKNSISGYGPQAKFRLVASPNGVSLASSYRGAIQGGKVHMRGKVKGFSRASARRFRHLLFGVDYSTAVAVTLTHPVVMDGMRGPERAFDALASNSKRLPWLRAMIWRKEVQRNGTPHYHCILFPSDGFEDSAAESLVKSWIDSCLAGWRVPARPPQTTACVLADVPPCFSDSVRSDMMKAHHDCRRPAIVKMDGSCYVRYLLDHESKHKREQAETSGRPWGVWNRSNLPTIDGFDCELTERQYWAAARILRKVCRYRIKAGCLFGWRHSRGRRASGIGRMDYFGRSNDGEMAHKIMPFVQSDSFEPFHDDLLSQGRFFRLQHCQEEDRLSPLD